jgi:hypothetical protein
MLLAPPVDALFSEAAAAEYATTDLCTFSFSHASD